MKQKLTEQFVMKVSKIFNEKLNKGFAAFLTKYPIDYSKSDFVRAIVEEWCDLNVADTYSKIGELEVEKKVLQNEIQILQAQLSLSKYLHNDDQKQLLEQDGARK